MSKVKLTDKKLTFVEWVARKKKIDIILEKYVNSILNEGVHEKGCMKKGSTCRLCEVSEWIDEYYKYVKQK